MNWTYPGLCACIALVATTPALAHHSFAMFDTTKPTPIEGTVKELQWTNPHIFIEVMVADAKTGKQQQWSVEGLPPNLLKRRGWARTMINPGDKISLVIFPLRSGDPGGALDKLAVNGRPVGTTPMPGAATPAAR